MEPLAHKIRFEKYLFLIQQLEGKRIKIQASDATEVGNLYSAESFELKAIKAETVIAALENVNPNITATIKQQTPGGDSTDLIVVVRVAYEFLPEINEEVVLEKQKISDQEGLKLQLMQREKEIMDLRKEFEDLSLCRRSLLKRVEKRTFKDSSEEVIEELQLEEGKYDVTLSFFALTTSSDNFITLQYYLDDEKLTKIPNNGWHCYSYNNANPYPYSIKILIDVKGRKNLRLKTWANDSHQWTVNNLILSAIKVRVA